MPVLLVSWSGILGYEPQDGFATYYVIATDVYSHRIPLKNVRLQIQDYKQMDLGGDE